MKKKEDHLEIPLECYENGSFELMTVEDVSGIIETINFLWLCMRDIYYWNIAGFVGGSCICKKTGKKGMKFGFLIHTNNGDPYTLLQAQKDLNKGEEIDDPNLCASWAAKFNVLFKEGKKELLPRQYWPFHHLEVPSGCHDITVGAYKLNPEYRTMVIVGVDRDSAYTNSEVPWEILSSKFTSKRQGPES